MKALYMKYLTFAVLTFCVLGGSYKYQQNAAAINSSVRYVWVSTAKSTISKNAC